jgi:hypothetical protein
MLEANPLDEVALKEAETFSLVLSGDFHMVRIIYMLTSISGQTDFMDGAVTTNQHSLLHEQAFYQLFWTCCAY